MSKLDSKSVSLVSQLRQQLSTGSFTEAESCALMILLREVSSLTNHTSLRWIADSIAHRRRDKSDIFYEVVVAMGVSHETPPTLAKELKRLDVAAREDAEQRIGSGVQSFLRDGASEGPLLPDGTFFSALNAVLKSIDVKPFEDGLRDIMDLFAVSILHGVSFGACKEIARTAVIYSGGHFAAIIGRCGKPSLRLTLIRARDPRANNSTESQIWNSEPMLVTFSNWLVEVSTV